MGDSQIHESMTDMGGGSSRRGKLHARWLHGGRAPDRLMIEWTHDHLEQGVDVVEQVVQGAVWGRTRPPAAEHEAGPAARAGGGQSIVA